MVARSPHARYTPAGGDGIGRLELTRPEKLNATDDDPLDLSALAGDRLSADWFRRWDVALAKLESIPVATVAAIQGPCLGGGLQITLCCDLRVASEDATFGLSAVRHGIVPGLATYRLPRLVGMGAAREMMLLGETWDAARAHRQGLVNQVVSADRLEATALALATKLAANVRAASVATRHRAGRWGKETRPAGRVSRLRVHKSKCTVRAVHMRRTITIVDARRQLGRLAEEVRRTGRAVVLTRRGRPVARIAPEPTSSASQPRDAFAALRGTVRLETSFLDLQRAIRALRGEFARSLARRAVRRPRRGRRG